MCSNRTKILQLVLTILDVDIEVNNIFLYEEFYSVSRIINTECDFYQ